MNAGNIIILTQYFLPETGAPQSRLYETALGLKERGWNVAIITAMPNYPSGKIFPGYKHKFYLKDSVGELDVHRYTLYPSNSPQKLPRIFSMLSFSATALFSAFKLRKFKPDYIFTESPPLALGLTGLALAKATGARHILNVSDLWPLSAYKLGALSKGRFYNMVVKLEKFLYRKSYACTGQSQQIIEHIRFEGGKRVHLFRNGVDIRRFANLVHIPPAKNDVPLKIIYTGLLGVAQGIAGICRHINFASLNAELHIYGEGSERTEIEQYIKDHPGTGIIYHGLVAREDIPATLSKADIALIPLIKPIEGAVPSKIYEAMAAGLPIIFSGGGEGEEIIKTYDAGWVCKPRKHLDIAACIGQIADSDRTALIAKRTNCLNAAKNVFNREIQIDQLHQLLLKDK